MRILIKLLCFCILVYMFNCIIDSIDTLYTLISKLGVLFLTISIAWHVTSYIWSIYSTFNSKQISSQAKCVLITGCDTGFGHATAIKLCDAGFTVFAGCLNSKSNESQNLLNQVKNSSKMHILKFDVTSDEDQNNVYQYVKNHLMSNDSHLHALINNAGITDIGAIEWGKIEDVQKVLDVNVYGSIKTTRHFIPLLVQCPNSRVISLTSYITTAAVPLMSSYGISKVALKAFCVSLRKEIEKDTKYFNGMKITTIEPTIYKTQMLGFDSMVNGLKRNWNSTSENVKIDYRLYFFDGLITFFKIWQFFEIFDFIALNQDLSTVSDTILHVVMNESPEKNYRIIGLLGRIGLTMATTYMPQELIETFYEISVYIMVIFAWEVKLLKNLLPRIFDTTKSS